MFTQLARNPLPSSGYCGIEVRNSGTSSTKINDVIIGIPNFIPPVCDTVDDTYPVVASMVPSRAVFDSSSVGNYYTARVTDLTSCAIRGTGVVWSSMIRDTVTGTHVFDSVHVTPPSSASNPLHYDYTFSLPVRQEEPGSYKILTTVVDSVGFVTQTTTFYTVQVTRTLTVMAYYDTWQMIPIGAAWWAEPPDRLDYTNGISHIIVFPNGNIVSARNPFFGPARYDSAGTMRAVDTEDSMDINYGTGRPTNPTHYLEDLIFRAHAANVRVMHCVNAVCADNITSVMDVNGNGLVDGLDSARTDTLAWRIAVWTNFHNLDGVDVNIEHGCGTFPSKAHISVLMRRLRIRLDAYNAGIGGRMTITFSPTSGDEGNYDAATSNANVDQINPQTYDNQYAWTDCIGGNMTWEAGPIYPPSDAPSCVGAGNLMHNVHQHGPYRWVSAGFSKTILGYGVSTYGRLRRGGTNSTSRYGTFPSVTTDGYAHNTQGFINSLLSPAIGGIQEAYDDSMESIAIHGTSLAQIVGQGDYMTVAAGVDFRYVYPTPRRIQADIDYIKTNGFRGLMLFDYQMDCDPANADITQRNWIINAAGQAAGGQIPLVPSAPVNIAPTNGAVSQSYNATIFTWSAITGAISYRFQIATDVFFNNIIKDLPSLTSAICQVGQNPFNGSLSPSTLYYWRVSAATSGGGSNFSTATSFTTVGNVSTLPHIPVQVAPTTGSSSSSTSVTLTVTLNPNFSDTVSYIKWQVKTDTLSGAFSINDSTNLSLTYSLSNLLPSVKYFWRAATKNSVGSSAYTGWFNFTINVNIPVPPKYKTPTVYDPIIRKNLPTGTPTSGLVFKDDPASSFASPAFGNLAWGPRQFKDSSGHVVTYVTFDNLPTSNTTITALSPLFWNAPTNTLSIFPVSATQAGYLAAAEYASRVQGSRFYWRLGSGARDSAGIVFKAGSNVTITQSTGVVDTVTISASGGGSSNPDTTIFTKMSLRDEFVRGNDGASNLASNTSGNSTTWQGELGWVPYALTVGNRAYVFTTGSQFVNTATYGGDIGWTYLVAPDSSDGTTPTGGWLTLAKNGPVIYARPVKAILYFFFQAPEADSSVSSIGISGKWQGAEDGRLLNTEQMSMEISNSNAAQETVYAVCANGSAKTRTFMQTAAAGSIWKGKIEMNSSSVSFYAGVKGGALSAATTISTNLPAGTNGLTPYIGGWTYKKRCNGAGINTNHVTAIGDWQLDWWVAK